MIHDSMAIFAVLVAAWLPAPPQPAPVDCSMPGRRTPAVPVPECVDSRGSAVACADPGHIRLWPNGLRPAAAIPPSRDSTDRAAGKTVPGRASGHELFASVDVVTVGGVSRRLYVAYNAGIQAWDIDPQADPDRPADPLLLAARDGWEGEFLAWPQVWKVVDFLEDVSAVNVSPTIDVVAAAGRLPAGASFWEFDASTRSFRQLYQDQGISARQIRLIQLAGGALYAIAASDIGVAVYDVTAARALASPCLDNQGSVCPTVFRGFVTSAARRYVDAIRVAGDDPKSDDPKSGDRIFVSASNGTSFKAPPIELWELADPQRPSAAVRRLSELRNAAGSALFLYDGHYYLAWVSEEDGLDKEKLRLLLIDGCVRGSDCSLAGGTVKDAVNPISLDPAPGEGADYGTTRDFLTYSQLAGKPYLYYGVATGGLRGPDVEKLFDLGSLRPPDPLPLAGFPEVTAAGGSYTDPCNGAKIRYWSHDYSRNAHGLNDMVPRIGKLSSGGYFYRAADTILDVHVLRSDPISADGFEDEVTARSPTRPHPDDL